MIPASRNRAYLSLGSNIDPETNLPRAVRELQNHGRIAAVSRVWETAPQGYADQPNFLNAAVLLETTLSAERLRREVIEEIERSLHRVRDEHNRNGPRTIDIDISLFNRDVFQVGRRTIPDPEILTRPFLAIPLTELDPEFVHPVDGRTLKEIAEALQADAPAMKLRPKLNLPADCSPSTAL